MSYFRRVLVYTVAPLLAALIAGPLVVACGFTPVFHENSQNQTRDNLSIIEVAPISGKRGVQLRNRLEKIISPAGSEEAARYRLSVELNSSTEAVLIQLDNTVTRQNLKMSVTFNLSDISTGTKIYASKAVSVGSYNVVDSEFATIAAEDNAAERAAREIGEEILDLLVVYFSRYDS